MATRIRRVETATVRLWDVGVGAVAWNDERGIAAFEYEPGFLKLGLEIAPLTMPLRAGVFAFPQLNRDTCKDLPSLLADSLPDRFGNRIIDVWLSLQGRSSRDFSPIERLRYVGTRGMGALEFKPSIGPRAQNAVPVEVSELTQLASDILRHRTSWAVSLKGAKAEALKTIIRIGTPAGGNRAKAIIAWNPKTEDVVSGQGSTPPGFEPWILKFDGVQDVAMGDPQGFGRVEYAYHRMAAAAGIGMEECRLLEENGRAHFMTRRFDRQGNRKIHMQSLCAMDHMDFNAPGEYSYEQAFMVVQRLRLGAPAFDVVWAFNPAGNWTNKHQMSINGKRDDFTKADLAQIAKTFGIKNAKEELEQVGEAVALWPDLSREAGVPQPLSSQIESTHRLALLKGERAHS